MAMDLLQPDPIATGVPQWPAIADQIPGCALGWVRLWNLERRLPVSIFCLERHCMAPPLGRSFAEQILRASK
jgi:hypothetical protein